MTNYHVACSPLSNRIYAGRVDKRGQTWASKSDVTGAASSALISLLPTRRSNHDKA